jgi:hypothetical protein
MSDQSTIQPESGGLWRLRLLVLATLAFVLIAARLAGIANAWSRSDQVQSAAESAASVALPAIPHGGVDWTRLNPHGIEYPADRSLPIGGDTALTNLWRWSGDWPKWAAAHAIGCLAVLAFVAALGKPRLLHLSAKAPTYFLRALVGLVLIGAVPGLLAACSYMPVRFFWGAVWFQANGGAWIDMGPLARIGPEVGAGALYVLCLTLVARRVVLRMARNTPLKLSVGREPQSAACLSCGYPIGTEGPCPECGTADPRAVPDGVYFGRWHARIAVSRGRWLFIALPVALVCALYAAPLTIGFIRAVAILVAG